MSVSMQYCADKINVVTVTQNLECAFECALTVLLVLDCGISTFFYYW